MSPLTLRSQTPLTTGAACIAALYDIHGNLPALEAVLREVRAAAVDLVVVGGDIAPGPMPRAVLELLQSIDRPVRFIHGNGDRAVLRAMRGEDLGPHPEAVQAVIRWSADQLRDNERELARWPPTLRVDVVGIGSVLFCHATPRNDTEVFTRMTPEAQLAPVFAGVDAAVVVCGHTHMPFDRTLGALRVVNAGSVGMPFGAPGADWLLLGPAIEARHTSYDLEAAATRIRGTSYPQAADFAARSVLDPPAADEMLAVFARIEVGQTAGRPASPAEQRRS